jgi:hypothetical protein
MEERGQSGARRALLSCAASGVDLREKRMRRGRKVGD